MNEQKESLPHILYNDIVSLNLTSLWSKYTVMKLYLMFHTEKHLQKELEIQCMLSYVYVSSLRYGFLCTKPTNSTTQFPLDVSNITVFTIIPSAINKTLCQYPIAHDFRSPIHTGSNIFFFKASGTSYCLLTTTPSTQQ